MKNRRSHLSKVLAALFAAMSLGLVACDVQPRNDAATLAQQANAAQSVFAPKLSDREKEEYETQIADLQEQLAQKQDLITDLQEQLEQKQDTITDLQEQLTQKQTQIDSLWERVAIAQQNLDEVYAKLDARASASKNNASSSNTSNAAKGSSESKSRTVYITKTGAKYHRSSCRYLRKSKISISLADAKSQGYTACSVCG